jgi:hypothetical protein
MQPPNFNSPSNIGCFRSDALSSASEKISRRQKSTPTASISPQHHCSSTSLVQVEFSFADSIISRRTAIGQIESASSPKDPSTWNVHVDGFQNARQARPFPCFSFTRDSLSKLQLTLIAHLQASSFISRAILAT